MIFLILYLLIAIFVFIEAKHDFVDTYNKSKLNIYFESLVYAVTWPLIVIYITFVGIYYYFNG